MEKQYAPVTWGVENLIPQGVSILAAKPKIGKSWFALQCVHAKASGTPLWDGRPAEKKATALFIGLEDNERRLQKRAQRSFPQGISRDASGNAEWKADPLENLFFSTTWPRIGQGGIKKLDQFLHYNEECDLVVIDTLARFRPATTSSNSYDDDYKVGERLKPIADKYSVAILLIHHTRKMEATDPFDTISGTQGLAGSVDAALVLTRLRG